MHNWKFEPSIENTLMELKKEINYKINNDILTFEKLTLNQI